MNIDIVEIVYWKVNIWSFVLYCHAFCSVCSIRKSFSSAPHSRVFQQAVSSAQRKLSFPLQVC